MTEMHDDLRERTREILRNQIIDHALDLIDERGFEVVTVDDIARAAGISSRSFFRYFPSKEDVVIGPTVISTAEFTEALAARPTDEPIWLTLRATIEVLVRHTVEDAPRSLRFFRIYTSTPLLRSRAIDKHLGWARTLTPILAERLTEPSRHAGMRAHALTHSAIVCFNAALAEWLALDGEPSLSELVDEAFAARD